MKIGTFIFKLIEPEALTIDTDYQCRLRPAAPFIGCDSAAENEVSKFGRTLINRNNFFAAQWNGYKALQTLIFYLRHHSFAGRWQSIQPAEIAYFDLRFGVKIIYIGQLKRVFTNFGKTFEFEYKSFAQALIL